MMRSAQLVVAAASDGCVMRSERQALGAAGSSGWWTSSESDGVRVAPLRAAWRRHYNYKVAGERGASSGRRARQHSVRGERRSLRAAVA
jgi:hypothetical protein